MRGRAVIAVISIALLGGCSIPMGSRTDNLPPPPEASTALDARLDRCAALGAKASADSDCQSAWAEARRRILPLPSEK